MKKRTQFRFDSELYERVKVRARQENVSMAEWLRRCLRAGLAEADRRDSDGTGETRARWPRAGG